MDLLLVTINTSFMELIGAFQYDFFSENGSVFLLERETWEKRKHQIITNELNILDFQASFNIFSRKLPKIKEQLGGCSVVKKQTHGAEELFVMVSESKIVQPIVIRPIVVFHPSLPLPSPLRLHDFIFCLNKL